MSSNSKDTELVDARVYATHRAIESKVKAAQDKGDKKSDALVDYFMELWAGWVAEASSLSDEATKKGYIITRAEAFIAVALVIEPSVSQCRKMMNEVRKFERGSGKSYDDIWKNIDWRDVK